MTFLIIFAILSVVSSILVVAAGMLSSRINQEENWIEYHKSREQFTAPDAAPQSNE